MTWTATEREAETIGGKAIDIRDDNGDLFCCVYAVLDHSAAIEQMRARARLIVQAEAMLDGLRKTATALDITAELLEEEGMSGTAEDIRSDALKARAIIKATETSTDG